MDDETKLRIIGAAGVLLTAINALASRRVWSDPLATQTQKLLQTLLVWLVPIIGAILVFFVSRQIDAPPQRAGKGFVEFSSPPLDAE